MSDIKDLIEHLRVSAVFRDAARFLGEERRRDYDGTFELVRDYDGTFELVSAIDKPTPGV